MFTIFMIAFPRVRIYYEEVTSFLVGASARSVNKWAWCLKECLLIDAQAQSCVAYLVSGTNS